MALKLEDLEMQCSQWFEFLKEPYRTEALEEVEKKGRLHYPRISLVDAINSFNWNGSKKGQSYWSNMARDIEKYGDQSKYINNEGILQLIS